MLRWPGVCHVGILGLKGRDALGHDVVAAQVAAADGDNAALQGAQLVRHVVEMVFQLVNLLDAPDELDPERGRETGRVFRSKMGAPACSSALRIIALNEGWAMCSFRPPC